MVENGSAHKRCSGCNQGFWHFNKAICVDAVGQLFWKQFREGVAAVEEDLFENLIDQVISVGEVGVRGGVLSDTLHLLCVSEY